MKEFKLIDKEVELYFATARERYQIMLRKNIAKLNAPAKSGPLSDDKIFNDWFFCNVFREDDKTTIWIKENVREPYRNNPNVLWMMVACRLFNKISTLKRLQQACIFELQEWNRNQAEAALEDVKPLTGAAYMVHTPYGMDKLRGCLKLVDDAARDNEERISLIRPGITTLEGFWNILLPADCFGPFMAYEVVTDLKHTYWLEHAPDIMTWASPGPGACLGLSRLVGEKVSYGSAEHRKAAIVCMQEILSRSMMLRHWDGRAGWPSWDMRTVEHWLCEHSKYCRVKFDGKRMKRKYGAQA